MYTLFILQKIHQNLRKEKYFMFLNLGEVYAASNTDTFVAFQLKILECSQIS